ncbi:MAG: hypothetical protein A07HR60_00324 [uncultured archaeon A07HR60]|nr:MAG: hypothetical protein A07HR60_00324 [uncultured archaeon A07HR60]
MRAGPVVVELVAAGRFQDGAVWREIAGENLDCPLVLFGILDRVQKVRLDIVIVRQVQLLEFLGDCPAGDGLLIAVEQACLHQAPNDGRHPADLVKIVHDVLAARLEVGDLRGSPRDLVEVLDIEIDARFCRQCQ